jgi:hypothetical protein
MTRSKIELAIILSKLRGKDEDPEVLANELSLMKLCYEIQKVEEEREASASAPEATDEPQASPSVQPEAPNKEPEPLTTKEEEIVEELKVPEKTSKEKRHKHILSWLLDSSSDEDEAA